MPRTLTVETHWTDRTRAHHPPKSKIRLKGAWLRQAGFVPGARVLVHVQANKLTISPAPHN